LAAAIQREHGMEVEISCELDEHWSFVQRNTQQRWRWHALERHTKTVVASVLGPHTDAVFKEVLTLLRPFRMTHDDPDGWASDAKYLPVEKHTISKRETQRIERTHLDFRTRMKRLARKTICFSTSCQMHDLVIGLFINRDEFGLEGQI
jgi:insertion element IS1 protein InsB